jgi:hypothetical protein
MTTKAVLESLERSSANAIRRWIVCKPCWLTSRRTCRAARRIGKLENPRIRHENRLKRSCREQTQKT